MESSTVEGSSSQGLWQNSTASPFVVIGMPNDNPTLEDNEINGTTNNSGNMEEEEGEESSHFESKKRHLKGCTKRAIFQKQQQRITLQVVDPDSMSQVVTPALVDKSQDKFVYDMVKSMKENFDKYWKECNLLMSVAAVLDPKCKMAVAKFTCPRMYSGDELKANIEKVEVALSELYQEYKNESVQPQKSELDNYLEEGVYICDDNSKGFDVLAWWRANSLRYRILSRMARDILVIPITTVASEATFSTGSRVIDTYRASLALETVEVLLCEGDPINSGCRCSNNVQQEVVGEVVLYPLVHEDIAEEVIEMDNDQAETLPDQEVVDECLDDEQVEERRPSKRIRVTQEEMVKDEKLNKGL
nr:hypothetical protein [Tanacetum cinerariifolium]